METLNYFDRADHSINAGAASRLVTLGKMSTSCGGAGTCRSVPVVGLKNE